MECRAFDEQVVRHDPQVGDLMDQFVCVRLVAANALDLTLFQFDYDLTFAVFFLNADRTVYGRFGSRSDQKHAEKDISIEGFRQALARALELHKGYPANKAALAGKQPRTPRFKSPDDYPSLHGRYKANLDYEGKVVASCVHCHQVREAERVFFRADRQPIPDEVLYPWPMPDAIGLALDPQEKAMVREVARDSVAMKAGFKTGDEIATLDGQPMLSIADVQWALHHAPQPATLRAQVLRAGKKKNLTLTLPAVWRRQTDISWRATTWDLRRMATGGLVLKEASAAERTQAQLAENDLALLVDYVGQYNEHAAGKRAGFQKGDVIVSVDGQSRRMSEGQFIGYLVQTKQLGDKVPLTVLRAGQRVNLELPMQ
ncbi:MAG: PDZ domain-containing protein [Verrucomicrobia bacterium]|nr:PDZ domain-containing protein [Verrucomicrobiota bacterium]